MGGGGGDQTSTTESQLSPQQQEAYDKLLAKADYGLTDGFYDKSLFGGEQTRADITDVQRQNLERLSGAGGVGTEAIGALEKTLGAYDPNNPALTGAIDMAAGDITRNLEENLLPSIGDSATQAGQYGSTRQGIAEGVALRGASEQVGDVATQMRLADMQTHQANQQNVLQNLGSVTSGVEFAGGAEQREAQARLDDLFTKWEYESSVGLKDLQAYRDLIGGDMGRTEVTQTSGGGK